MNSSIASADRELSDMQKYIWLRHSFLAAVLILATTIQAFPKAPAVVNVDLLIVGGTVVTMNDKRGIIENGAIAIRWVGIEESAAILDAAMGIAADLASPTIAASPYR